MLTMLFVGTAVLAQAPGTGAPGGKIPDDQLLSYLPKDGVPAGTIPWLTFRQVKLVEQKKDGKTTLMPEFAKVLRDLDNKPVKLYGFVLPLSTTTKQKHFLLSSVPLTCSFCVPGGPESMVEVKTKVPVAYTMEPVTVEGRFAVLNDDPYGLYYRVTDAVGVK